MNEPIAIIGMGCRYPQAPTVDAFWRLLVEGGDAIQPYAEHRFPEFDAAYAKAAAGEGGIATHLGGFLPNIDRFDASFFGISPREAAFIDPQQRLLLEVSWNALEDAGQLRKNYYGSRTGVFTGLWTTDYENHIFRNSDQPEFYLLTGGGRSTACGRLSFTFGFEGPSISVDTACSSSMVAVHLACQSLRQGECDMALAGGVNVILSTDFTRLFTNAGMLSDDGRCKFGDQSANGFVRSEGAAMIVLKRLSDALRDGDGIYAVIRGSAVNNDGKSSGLLVTPSRDGQRTMLLEAWRQAGIRGADLSYIEAHGTGTHVGDPIEIGAISDALIASGAEGRVILGSLKTNLGHTESAAGVAGIIKTALVLSRGVIPASLYHLNPNTEIAWDTSPIEIAAASKPLPSSTHGKLRLAGASSFGLTGTNAHIVLEECAARDQHNAKTDGLIEQDASARHSNYLLPVSGHTREALKLNLEGWLGLLKHGPSPQDLTELTYLAGARRTALTHRASIIGGTAAEMCEQIESLLSGGASFTPQTGTNPADPQRVVFVAPGQGSQWNGMARELFHTNLVFRAAFLRCDQAIAFETGWSLVERLEGDDAADYLAKIDFVQPALFAMTVALAAVWQAAGVTADAVIGHSMGEVAAAHLAGVLTLADAAAVICRRSRLMRTLSGSGAMASIEMPAAELALWLEQFAGKISIAAENSPGTTVISGESAAVDQLIEWLELKEVYCRRVKVDVASHSWLVDPILEQLQGQLADILPASATIPFFSTVLAAPAEGRELDGSYWVKNLREPVRLAAGITSLAEAGYRCFIELSPHPVLIPALEATLLSVPTLHPFAVPSLLREKPAWRALLASMGRLWTEGCSLDWGVVTGRGNGPISHRLSLPDYAFERESYWPLEQAAAAPSAKRQPASQLTPLLLNRTDPATDPGTSVFSVCADLDSLPYLLDHRVGGAIVYPASAHLEAAFEAAALLMPGHPVTLSEVQFVQALYLAAGESQQLQLIARKIPGEAIAFRFSLCSRQGTGEGGWVEHSTGLITRRASDQTLPTIPGAASGGTDNQAELLATPVESQPNAGQSAVTGSAEQHYARALRSGIHYGPAFQLVESFSSFLTDGVAGARTVLRFDAATRLPEYLVHPTLLDNCFQAMLHLQANVPGMSGDSVYLPLSIGRLEVLESPTLLDAGNERLVAEATFSSIDRDAGTLEFGLRLKTKPASGDGRVLVVVEQMRVQRVKTAGEDPVADDLYSLVWKPIPTPDAPKPAANEGKHWLIFADGLSEAGNAEVYRLTIASALAQRQTASAGRCTLVWLGKSFRALPSEERRLDLLGADEYELAAADPASLDTLLKLVTAEAGRVSDILDLWTLNHTPVDKADTSETLKDILGAQVAGTQFLSTLVQAMNRANWIYPPRLWLLTQGTQAVGANRQMGSHRLSGATVWGFGSAILKEMPEFSPTLLDLSALEANFASDHLKPELESLFRLLSDSSKSSKESRLALRRSKIFAARLIASPLSTVDADPRTLQQGEAYRVEVGRAGALDQLQLRAILNPLPGPAEVVIEVAYAGLNFIDVTKALGIYPGLDAAAPIQMGGECSGRILAVGSAVIGFEAGDEVVALTPSPTRVGLMASRVVVPAELVSAKPSRLTLAESATVPIAYLTAHYALNELARLRQGEWVLIHAAAGGVGLAAVSIAHAIGARVIATASSPEKHAFLRSWGVNHVLPSRTCNFADEVMRITEGRGVDVVLNSLAGDFIPASLGVLAAYGRFIELGKRDIYADRRIGLKAFRQNIAYFAVDLAALIEDRRAYAASLFREVMVAIASGAWALPPLRSFSSHQPAEAFRFMAEGRHIGKLLLAFNGSETDAHAAVGDTALLVLPPIEKADALFRKDATYVITGGLGGVGAAVAVWMASNQAGHLVLVSRRAAGPAEQKKISQIEDGGAIVTHWQIDLLDAAATRELFDEIARSDKPLRGVFHAAAVIDDALLSDMVPARFEAVFGPKISGTWNLHQATLTAPLDYFVLFSSIASIFSQPGHGSYAAANSFLDSFAGYRRQSGLPAISINWAGWLAMGLARETGTSRTIEAYEAEGLFSFTRDQALHCLGQALRANPVQATAVRIAQDRVEAGFGSVPALLKDMVTTTSTPAVGNFQEQISSRPPEVDRVAEAPGIGERLLLVEDLLRQQLSLVLKLAPERMGSNQPFGHLGVDSLMALEFVRRVNGLLGLALPATAVFNYPTFGHLSAQILKRLDLHAAQDNSAPVALPENNTCPKTNQPSELPALRVIETPPQASELSEEEAMQALMNPGGGLYGY